MDVPADAGADAHGRRQVLVLPERERPLDLHALQTCDARGKRRVAVAANVPGDVLDLGLRHGRIPDVDEGVEVLRNGRPGEVDPFEQPVDCVAHLGRVEREPTTTAGRRPARGAHARHPLGVVAVRATLEQRERAVREPRDALERRIGHDGELP